eukprot:TRINITY_DN6487_c0_g1_i2.p1 TRINITY_DN6487_c0_g1~~TRINITY_DN6487_c0_g1_i2.p1  ORF type:complete len:287 (-),score=60.60 TRINITY_DN6487_c0_g1_i2:25-885(-)
MEAARSKKNGNPIAIRSSESRKRKIIDSLSSSLKRRKLNNPLQNDQINQKRASKLTDDQVQDILKRLSLKKVPQKIDGGKKNPLVEAGVTIDTTQDDSILPDLREKIHVSHPTPVFVDPDEQVESPKEPPKPVAKAPPAQVVPQPTQNHIPPQYMFRQPGITNTGNIQFAPMRTIPNGMMNGMRQPYQGKPTPYHQPYGRVNMNNIALSRQRLLQRNAGGMQPGMQGMQGMQPGMVPGMHGMVPQPGMHSNRFPPTMMHPNTNMNMRMVNPNGEIQYNRMGQSEPK